MADHDEHERPDDAGTFRWPSSGLPRVFGAPADQQAGAPSGQPPGEPSGQRAGEPPVPPRISLAPQPPDPQPPDPGPGWGPGSGLADGSGVDGLGADGPEADVHPLAGLFGLADDYDAVDDYDSADAYGPPGGWASPAAESSPAGQEAPAGAGPASGAEPEVRAEPESGAEPENGAGPDDGAGPENVAGPETRAEPGIGVWPDSAGAAPSAGREQDSLAEEPPAEEPPAEESPAAEPPAAEPPAGELPAGEQPDEGRAATSHYGQGGTAAPPLRFPPRPQPPHPQPPHPAPLSPKPRRPEPSHPAPLRQFPPPSRPPEPPGETADSLTADLLLPGRFPAPADGWRRVLHRSTGGLIRVPPSAAARQRQELEGRACTPVAAGHYRVAVLSLKGGVGKTTTVMGLGATLASLRGDRVIAVDANPDRGTLSDKLRLETSATVRDLLNERGQVTRYADVRAYTTQAPSRLEVLASDRDPTVSVAFGEQDYLDVAQVLAQYYSVCITDCGTGLLYSAMAGVLRLADRIILVSSPSVDGARSASATLDWLTAHGHGHLVRSAVVVLSAVRPQGKSTVDLVRLEQHFAARCRAVQRVPYDDHLAEGAEVDLARLGRETADAYLALAAEIGDGFAGRSRPAWRPAR